MSRKFKTTSIIVIICMFFGSMFLLLSHNTMSNNGINISNLKMKVANGYSSNLNSLDFPLYEGASYKSASIFFINESMGWFGGKMHPWSENPIYHKSILGTYDGGYNWTFQNTSYNGPDISWPDWEWMQCKKIQFFNESHGYALFRADSGNDFNFLLNTSNGGETWKFNKLNRVSIEDSLDMHFFNYSHGIISNSTGIIITDDGANTWTYVVNDLNLVNFDFINSTYGFAIANYNRSSFFDNEFYYTNDSGKNWYLRCNTSFSGIDFINATHGWGVERFTTILEPYGYSFYRVLNTTDGGYSWEVQQLLNRSWTGYKVCFTSENHGCITGSEEIFITKDGGQTWSFIDTSAKWGDLPFGFEGIDQYCYIHDLFFLDSNTGWLLGQIVYYLPPTFGQEVVDPAVILKTEDGGDSWELIGPDVTGYYLPYVEGQLEASRALTASNDMLSIFIIVGIIGGSVAVVSSITILRRKKKAGIKKQPKSKKREKMLQELTYQGDFVGVSDINLDIKLRRLIKSEIPPDSVKDESVLEFLDQEFNILPVEEINRILNLNIPNISEKIEILDELACLSSDERKDLIESLENLDRNKI